MQPTDEDRALALRLIRHERLAYPKRATPRQVRAEVEERARTHVEPTAKAIVHRPRSMIPKPAMWKW